MNGARWLTGKSESERIQNREMFERNYCKRRNAGVWKIPCCVCQRWLWTYLLSGYLGLIWEATAARQFDLEGSTDSIAPGWFEDVFSRIKREASPEELYRFLYAVPKGGDLHHHHGGSIFAEDWYRVATDPELNGGIRYFTRYRIENCGEDGDSNWGRSGHDRSLYWVNINEWTWKALSQCHRREFKPIEKLTRKEREVWEASMVLDRPGEGRNEFFENHWSRINELFDNPYVMAELLVENMKRFGAEGLIYLEPQIGSKGFHDREGKPLSSSAVNEIYKERISRPDARETGVTVRFLVTVLRFREDAPQQIMPTFEFISRHNDLWRGINMAGREDNQKGYPARFTKAFDDALRRFSGIGISIHAGEQDEPSSHIFDTLRLGATRIGHAVNLIHDAHTMQLMRSGQFMLEINLVSNHMLEYVEHPREHPFPIYLRHGIPCALSTDDRGMFDSNMTDEYYTAVSNFDLTWEELDGLGRNSLRFSFAQPGVVADLLELYGRKIAEFEERFSVGDWRNVLVGVHPEGTGYGRRHLGLNLAF